MEGNRRKIGERNQLTILKDGGLGGGQCEVVEVNNLLSKLGFKIEEVKGIQDNVFKPSQIEVTFEKDGEGDMNEIEKRLKERKVMCQSLSIVRKY